MKNNILIISYFLPPVLGAQSIQIGRLLYYYQMLSDDNIMVVSGMDCNSIIDRNLYRGFSDKFSEHDIIYNKFLLPNFFHRIANKLIKWYGNYPDPYIWWCKRNYDYIQSKIIDKGVNKVVTFGQPMSDHILGLKIKKNNKQVKWIAHFSDPWCDNTFRNNKKYDLLMETQVIENADIIIFTSEETRQQVMRKYDTSYLSKTYILNHSFDSSCYPKTIVKKETIFSYIGNFYGKRSPETLFRAIRILYDEDPQLFTNISFQIIGEISERFKFESWYREIPHDVVKIIGSVDYFTSLQYMVDSDCLIIIDAPADENIFFPSKLADYIGSGKYIFGLTPNGTSRRIIKGFGYECCNPMNINDIVFTLKRLLTEKLYLDYDINWEKRNNYSCEKNAKIFCDIIKNL